MSDHLGAAPYRGLLQVVVSSADEHGVPSRMPTTTIADTFTASQIVAVSVATSADPELFSGGDWLNSYRAAGAEAFTLDVGRELATINEDRDVPVNWVEISVEIADSAVVDVDDWEPTTTRTIVFRAESASSID